MKSFFKGIFILIIIAFSSCVSSKKLPEPLLDKNYFVIEGKREYNSFFDKNELIHFVKQKPNKKIFGLFRFHLGLYKLAGEKPEGKIRNFFREIGEPPVFIDYSLVERTKFQLQLFFKNKGFYNLNVSDSVRIKNNKAEVKYYIKLDKPYKIDSINYKIKDKSVEPFVLNYQANSSLKVGTLLDLDILQNEVNRITSHLKNSGYYDFSKELVYFEVDTNSGADSVIVELNIVNPILRISSDSIIEVKQTRYRIGNIYINTEFKPGNISEKYDTLIYDSYFFIYKNDLKYKAEILKQQIYFKKDDYYQHKNINKTYTRIAALKLFRYINLSFAQRVDSSGKNVLDCYIQLTPTAQKSITLEGEGTHNSGNLGLSGNISYQNKNAFKGGEIFELKFTGGAEAQHINGQTLDRINSPFNTLEFGSEMHLSFPKFLLPLNQEKFYKTNEPKTVLSAVYNFQKRPDYVRDISRISFGYSFKETIYKNHTINPIELNFVKINAEEDFLSRIEQFKDFYLKSTFTDHLTANSRWTFVYNDQDIKRERTFNYFVSNFEVSGNILGMFKDKLGYGIDSLGRYTIFNVAYSQYIKSDIDYRRYIVFNKNNTLVFRYFTGVGYPYKNSSSMPFEKSYFVGGTNDIRAWHARSLGPGSYSNSDGIHFDKTGDIKIEANIEYRFGVYKNFKGAIFADLGNIWLFNKDSDRPNGEFSFNRFSKEIAIGSGIGLRYDFSFVIIRLDAGIPIYNPTLQLKNKWEINSIEVKDIIFNLGIGYPF